MRHLYHGLAGIAIALLAAGCGGGGGGVPTPTSITPGLYYGSVQDPDSGYFCDTTAIVASGNRAIFLRFPSSESDPRWEGATATIALDQSDGFTIDWLRRTFPSTEFIAAYSIAGQYDATEADITGAVTDESGPLGGLSLLWSADGANAFAGWYEGTLTGSEGPGICAAVSGDGTLVMAMGAAGEQGNGAGGEIDDAGVVEITAQNTEVTIAASGSGNTISGTITYAGPTIETFTLTRQP
jgi:hypothetical protein